LRGVRKTTPLEACAARSMKIANLLASHDALQQAKVVALFWPMIERHEVDLRALDATLRARGVDVAYPSIDPETGAMVFRIVDDAAQLAEAGYGFAEPPSSAPLAADLDVVVVP